MRTNIFFALLFCLFLPVMAAASEFSSVIEDLPLMPGMQEMKDRAVVFDKPGGRILETTTTTATADVSNFYANALPPLGWRTAGNNAYIRNGELLTITVEKNSVQFKITPMAK